MDKRLPRFNQGFQLKKGALGLSELGESRTQQANTHNPRDGLSDLGKLRISNRDNQKEQPMIRVSSIEPCRNVPGVISPAPPTGNVQAFFSGCLRRDRLSGRNGICRRPIKILAALFLSLASPWSALAVGQIVNGDFSAGNFGFDSDYTYVTSGASSTPGTYGIRSNPQDFNPAYSAFSDHSGTGQMMVIDAAGSPNLTVWSETISVVPNSIYPFSAWAASSDASNPATLKFFINGAQVGADFSLNSNAGQWQSSSATWNSGASTLATISIVDANTAGAGNDFALDDIALGASSAAVSVDTASPSQAAYVAGNYSTSGAGQTYTYASYEVRPGASATLAPNDTLVLTDGPLYVAPGAVLTANGSIQGNVVSGGLVRIPITPVDSISHLQGGVVQIALPVAPAPNQPIVIQVPQNQPVVLQSDTFLGFSPPSPDSTPSSAGGGGGGGGGGFSGATVQWNGPSFQSSGTLALDASLAITGSFTQTETGALRLFIAGDVNTPGDALHPEHETFSVLTAGDHITLDGSLQIVLQPELFGFLPHHGETFDVIKSEAGISIEPGLHLLSLVTAAGSSYLGGFGATQSSFFSGFPEDPDSLNLLDPSLWQFHLIDGGTVLQLEFVGVPEPSSYALSMMALLGASLPVAFKRRRTVKQPTR